jgi:putative copper resistance protein D
LLAAGAWIGGLLVLTHILAYTQEGAEPVLMRFSGMGYVAVAVLVASGLVNGWYLVGSLNGLVGTSYGQLLLVKICLFAGMLCLAVANRFWLVPLLRRVDEVGRVLSLGRLRRHVVAEWTLGLLVILIVSALGTMEPASP